MIEVIRKVCKYDAPQLWYESVDEAERAAGKVGVVLQECNLNLSYRGANQDGRDILWDIISERTSVPPLMKESGKKDANGQAILVIAETEEDYFDRALASTPSVTHASVQEEFSRRSRGYDITGEDGKVTHVDPVAVDIRQKERKAPKPRTLPKEILAKAQAILAAGQQKLEKVIHLITKDLGAEAAPVFGDDPAKNADALGWKIKAHLDWMNKQRLEKY